MRWIKHFTNASDGEFVSWLIDEHGLEGYARWWIILEKIGARMDKSDCCSASYSVAKWASFLRQKQNKMKTFLKQIENKSKISLELNGNILTIEVPNLLKYKDNYTKDLEASSKKLPSKEVEVEVEVEVEEDKDIYIYNKNRNKKTSKDVGTEPEKTPAPMPSPTVIEIPLQGKDGAHKVTEQDIAQYRQSYPALNVLQVLRNIRQWCLDNPGKRKTKRGAKRFITTWFNTDIGKGHNLLQSQGPLASAANLITCSKCGSYYPAGGQCMSCM